MTCKTKSQFESGEAALKKIGSITLTIIAWAIIAALAILTVYPVLYALLGSLKTNAELQLGSAVLPKVAQWQNYYTAFITSHFLVYGENSVIISLCTMILSVFTCALAGFVFARYSFVGKKVIMVSYTALMFVSIGSVALYPIMQVLQKINMDKSMLSLILVLTGSQIMNVFLVMGFVKEVPRELDEAASIDGCSLFRTFWQIITPLIRPILAVVALFTFRNTWNDYITTLIMTMSNPKLMTLTVAVVQLKYSVFSAAQWHIMLAGASLAIIPVLILYAFTNKQFISGLTAGAVKG